MDAETLRETFRRDGIVFLDGVLRGSALASFQDQVSRELSRPAIPPESGTPTGVALSDPSTWPKGNARRVIEVVPPGVGEHWRALATAPELVRALDALLGDGAWELPDNQPHGGPCDVRHWYCPVVFPEAAATDEPAADDDPARAIEDLRGYRCAYNAAHSQSGYNALRHLLAPLASGEPFFSKTLATGAHRGSMVAVRDREADVCAVDCVTWALSQDVDNCCDGLRIVALTASAPALPYITHRLRSNVDVAALQDALMDALQQVPGVTRSALRLRGFSVLSSKDYDVICEMQDAAIELGFPELQ